LLMVGMVTAGVDSSNDSPVVQSHGQSSETEISVSSQSSVSNSLPHHHQQQQQHAADISKKRSGWVFECTITRLCPVLQPSINLEVGEL